MALPWGARVVVVVMVAAIKVALVVASSVDVHTGRGGEQ
jgi:hypothetical protein